MANQTKAQESVETLKNVNKHLSEVFKQIEVKDSALNYVANDLRQLAAKCGELKVEVFVTDRYQNVSLKTRLNELVTKLEGAKS